MALSPTGSQLSLSDCDSEFSMSGQEQSSTLMSSVDNARLQECHNGSHSGLSTPDSEMTSVDITEPLSPIDSGPLTPDHDEQDTPLSSGECSQCPALFRRDTNNLHMAGSGYSLTEASPSPVSSDDTMQDNNATCNDMNVAERLISSFTAYAKFHHARHKRQPYEPVFQDLLSEWTYVGTLLAAFIAVDIAVFAMSQDALFTARAPVARQLIATSSCASGVGILGTLGLFFRYSSAPTSVLIARSQDAFDSHFLFALSARTPMLCALVSAVAIMLFMMLASWKAFPECVAVVTAVFGMMMTLQVLASGVSGVWRTASRLVRLVSGCPAEQVLPSHVVY